MDIKLLDCTLRDGGYINNWEFDNTHSAAIIKAIDQAGVECIECGYLSSTRGKEANSTMFKSLEIFQQWMQKHVTLERLKAEIFLMVNYGEYGIDLFHEHRLEDCSYPDGIRLAFHKKDSEAAVTYAEKLLDKGYKVCMQPMLTIEYSDSEILKLIEQCRELALTAFYIVDSFGYMTERDINRYYYLMDNNLPQSVRIGFHGHNNLQLSYSNSVNFLAINPKRKCLLDATIFGIGRSAGNLNTEIIAHHLNQNNNKHYNLESILQIIDNYIEALRREKNWSYSVTHFLSAMKKCHPEYAAFFVNRKTLNISEIKHLLDNIPVEKLTAFDSGLAEHIYNNFNLAKGRHHGNPLPADAFTGRNVLILASGKSVVHEYKKVEKYLSEHNPIIIAVNHYSPFFQADYYFFSNQKRLNEFTGNLEHSNVIITSNLQTQLDAIFIVDFKELFTYDDLQIRNVAVLVLILLIKNNVKAVTIAGLDGYQPNTIQPYSYPEYDQPVSSEVLAEANQEISKGLKHLFNQITIKLLTTSIFLKDIPLRILGVIPARYQSSRFPGKPLALIAGVPMLERTYRRVCDMPMLDNVVVATDDCKIFDFCRQQGIPVEMTSSGCLTGTDRITEIANKLEYDFYINIQGDEPVIDPQTIAAIVAEYQKYGNKYIAYNMYKEIDEKEELNSPNSIKVIVNEADELIYMSRCPAPFNKSGKESIKYYKQVCVYGFTREALFEFKNYPKTCNERYEDIEILRFIDLGYKVKMIKTDSSSIAVDAPEDILKVEEFLNAQEATNARKGVIADSVRP